MKEINAEQVADMLSSGAANLNAAKDSINELNVFPVPDGDTGTNMTRTITSAASAVRGLDPVTMDGLNTALSRGALRGARGNSGVILSQLARGFGKEISGHEKLTVPILADACSRAVETAYKAVIKPKEGTILTVARGFEERFHMLSDRGERDVLDVFRKSLDYGNKVLERTPEMLPQLKEAGVVDSGGKGLLTILEGCYEELNGTFDRSKLETPAAAADMQPAAVTAESSENIRYGYCTEFIINLSAPMPKKEVGDFKHYLTSIGDSLVLVAADDLVKVHVHTNDPGEVISHALTYGPLTNMKIDNMRVEHQEKVIRDSERLAAQQKKEDEEAEHSAADGEPAANPAGLKKAGFIAVCAGEGFRDIFRELGADAIISGGQTMNPSTDDILKAADSVPAENIFVLPNNGNIILAANQAADLAEEKNIIVVPSRTVPQGISAMIGYVPEEDPESNLEMMKEAIGAVRTASVTYAVRDTVTSGMEIHKGDIMAVGDDGILCTGSSIKDVAEKAAAELENDDTELLSVYYGKDWNREEAEQFGKKLEEAFPDTEVQVRYGGQPVYYCLISAE